MRIQSSADEAVSIFSVARDTALVSRPTFVEVVALLRKAASTLKAASRKQFMRRSIANLFSVAFEQALTALRRKGLSYCKPPKKDQDTDDGVRE